MPIRGKIFSGFYPLNSAKTHNFYLLERKMRTFKLNSENQVTIPKKVREFLGLGKDDWVAFAISDGEVILKKFPPIDLKFHRFLENILDEWKSDKDLI